MDDEADRGDRSTPENFPVPESDCCGGKDQLKDRAVRFIENPNIISPTTTCDGGVLRISPMSC
ncbi:MAG: hypothetical protein ACLU48_15160 [Clostridiaceae bacterium]